MKMTQRVYQPRAAESPTAIPEEQVYKELKGYKVMGVVTPDYNCCVQKVVGELAPYLKQNGIAPTMAYDANPRQIIEALPHNIVYLRAGVKTAEPVQHLAQLDGYIPFFRSLGLEVYYYIDDALFFVNNMAPLKLMWNVDKIIVATDALAEFLIENQKMPKPIYKVKTHMDLPVFDACFKPLYLVKPNMFNILFTSQGRVGALTVHNIMEQMDKHPEKYKNVNFVIVSAWVGQMRTILNRFRNIHKTYWEWMPLQEHYGLSKCVDLIIAPGQEEDLDGQVEKEHQYLWLHSKSCVKYTLAGAARIPIISTPLNEYEKAIRHGETGFLANTVNEWIEYIDLCINDKDMCTKIGDAARDDVELNWHVVDRAAEWAGILGGKTDNLISGVDHESKSSDLHTELELPSEGISGSVSGESDQPDISTA
jgi:glycosyltransferase involved in cell wall biosynthesis